MEISLYAKEIHLWPFPRVFESICLQRCTKFGTMELPEVQNQVNFPPGVTSSRSSKQSEPKKASRHLVYIRKWFTPFSSQAAKLPPLRPVHCITFWPLQILAKNAINFKEIRRVSKHFLDRYTGYAHELVPFSLAPLNSGVSPPIHRPHVPHPGRWPRTFLTIALPPLKRCRNSLVSFPSLPPSPSCLFPRKDPASSPLLYILA